MAEVVGKVARVRMDNTILQGIKSWTLDLVGDALDTTDFNDSGHRTFLAGLDGWTGSFEGFGQPGWDTGALVGTKYLGSFFVSSSAGSYYSGSVIITGAHPAVSIDGLATVSYDFQGTGALTYT